LIARVLKGENRSSCIGKRPRDTTGGWNAREAGPQLGLGAKSNHKEGKQQETDILRVINSDPRRDWTHYAPTDNFEISKVADLFSKISEGCEDKLSGRKGKRTHTQVCHGSCR
jgi:hypothetical protein